METELESFYQQILDSVQNSLEDSLKTVISSLSARQDNLEKVISSSLEALNEQLDNMRTSVSNHITVPHLPITLPSNQKYHRILYYKMSP